MRIESSAINLKSSNSASTLYEKTEQLTVGRIQTDKSGNQSIVGLTASQTIKKESSFLTTFEQFQNQTNNSALKSAADKIAEGIRQTPTASSLTTASTEPTSAEDILKLNSKDRMNILLLLQMLESFRKKDPDLLKALGIDDLDTLSKANTSAQTANVTNPQNTNALAMEYSMSETLKHTETAEFSAVGEVKTSDGQTINININLLMNRETVETKNLSARVMAATKDPLVINFDGTAAELNGQRFSFDLTGNGQKDSIATLSGNSAFLAMDKNHDGTVNDGNELFGTKSGDGFADLEQYDDDKNGWIDENDAAFKDLYAWLDAGTENQKLVGLKEAGVGAIYTGRTATNFHLQNQNNTQENLGVIRSTGVYLKENGGVGTMQQVDLAV